MADELYDQTEYSNASYDPDGTPTSDVVRATYATDYYMVTVRGGVTAEQRAAAFDRWLAAVEAAVRADQAVECNNARFELLRELAAAQAVIAAVQGFLDDERVEGDEHDDHVWLDDANSRLDDIRALTAQSPTDALQAVKAAAWDEGYGDDMECHVPRINPYRAEPSTPEQPEGEKP